MKKKKKNNFLCPQPCPTLWDPMDCIPPGFSVYGILHTRTLEWVGISFSRGSSQPIDLIYVSCTGRQILYQCTTWEDLINSIPLTNLFFPERNSNNVLNGRPLGSLSSWSYRSHNEEISSDSRKILGEVIMGINEVSKPLN